MVARRERAREGLGLMGVGGGVFAVAAFAAAVASPLASELTSAIRRDVTPVAQASVEAAAASGSTAVRVLRMPPLPLLPGESALGIGDAAVHQSARAFGLSQRAVRQASLPAQSALAPQAAPAPPTADAEPVAAPVATSSAADPPGRGNPPSTAKADRAAGRGNPSGEDSAQASSFSTQSSDQGSARGNSPDGRRGPWRSGSGPRGR